MKTTLQNLISALREMSHYEAVDYDRIVKQIGETHLQARLERQLNLYERQSGRVRKKARAWYRKLIVLGLTCSGLMHRAQRQARNPVWVEQEWFFENLPESFDGYRILQLTDFHFDFIPELPGIINDMLSEKSFDLCVLTGDFRGETTGPYEESLADLSKTREGLGEKVYAVLGNHDNVELMLKMPNLGVELLMNQVVEIERGGEKIQLAGIDDPHYYKTHHFEFLKPDAETFTLLLAHSPECWREAEAQGIDLQLSGHTHGGQICLPGGVPVIAHLEGCSRDMIRGRWKSGHLQGYTSRGVGSSSLDLRLNCPPEITLHTLRRKTPSSFMAGT